MRVSPCRWSSTLGCLGDGDRLVHMGSGAGSRHHLREGGAVRDGYVHGPSGWGRRSGGFSKPSNIGLADRQLEKILQNQGHQGLATGALRGGRVGQAQDIGYEALIEPRT